MSYEEQRAALVAYLKMKVEQADWHGVSDAANDLRVLEAEHGEWQGAQLLQFSEQLRDSQRRVDTSKGT